MKADKILGFNLLTFIQVLVTFIHVWHFFSVLGLFISLFSRSKQSFHQYFLDWQVVQSLPSYALAALINNSLNSSYHGRWIIILLHQIWADNNRGMWNGQWKHTTSLQCLWLPDYGKAHSNILIGLVHNILWVVLNASLKWEHMIFQCILCNTSVAIPGPLMYPSNMESLTTFSHFQASPAFENILINEIRGKRKCQFFFF